MVYDWKNKIKKVKVMFEMVHIWIIALFLAIGFLTQIARGIFFRR